uniref:hypothetical protein n=1 Tax=Escherichia coli TaxID=562 RepID=UPI0020336B30|nr:hypothetical protein [Escherichia coli]
MIKYILQPYWSYVFHFVRLVMRNITRLANCFIGFGIRMIIKAIQWFIAIAMMAITLKTQ